MSVKSEMFYGDAGRGRRGKYLGVGIHVAHGSCGLLGLKSMNAERPPTLSGASGC